MKHRCVPNGIKFEKNKIQTSKVDDMQKKLSKQVSVFKAVNYHIPAVGWSGEIR